MLLEIVERPSVQRNTSAIPYVGVRQVCLGICIATSPLAAACQLIVSDA
jgi:hypothetical protein